MDTKLRAWWSHRQGLDGSLAGMSAADVLLRSGWARSIGGSAPYLTLFARAGLRRAEVDEALAKLEIHELPSARGCTYILPAADYSLGLAVGQPFSGDELKVASRLGVTDEEIDKLRAAISKALAAGPLDPAELKAKVGSAARNLGPEGVKKGLTTTLPVALGLLQSTGQMRRVPVNGRLDHQRYRYTAWDCPVAGTFTDLARRFFGWLGPATIAEFQGFSGLGVKASKTAIEPLKLAAAGEDRFLLPEDQEAFLNFQAPKRPQYVLVSGLDGMFASDDRGAVFPNQAILDRGCLVGRWEFDTATGKVVWASSIARDRALEEAVRRTEAFVREDLGDARIASLDSPKSRGPRIEALRKAARA
jgi:hypothetical protein